MDTDGTAGTVAFVSEVSRLKIARATGIVVSVAMVRFNVGIRRNGADSSYKYTVNSTWGYKRMTKQQLYA